MQFKPRIFQRIWSHGSMRNGSRVRIACVKVALVNKEIQKIMENSVRFSVQLKVEVI